MSIFKKSWWHHHIKKWKAAGDILGITGKLNKSEKDTGKFLKQKAENANKDIGGDQRYTGGYKDQTSGESVGDAVGQSIALGEGDEE